jgi:putative spermidine/putrescine transport system permease protein
MAVLAPMLTGIVVRTFAWMTLLSDKGVINQILISAGLITRPLQLMYNETGIVIGLVHIYVPFMVLTLTGVIGRIDERLEQAAENLGASPLRAFFEVTLPLSLPGILAGSLLVFALAISAYVTPILLGGFQIMTLPILIYQQISANFNIGFAAALGMILLVISLLLVIGYNRVLGLVAGQPELQ